MVRLRTADELADISYAAWERMTIPERAAVLIEHFAGGAVFEPIECGFCRDAHAVIHGLADVHRTLREERDEARDDYRLLKRDVEELLRRLPVDLPTPAANARLAVVASLHIVR